MKWKKVSWQSLTGPRENNRSTIGWGIDVGRQSQQWAFGPRGQTPKKPDPWDDINGQHLFQDTPPTPFEEATLKDLIPKGTGVGLDMKLPQRFRDKIMPGSTQRLQASRWKRIADANGTPYYDVVRDNQPNMESPPAPLETAPVSPTGWTHMGDNGIEIYPSPMDDPKIIKEIMMGYQGVRWVIPKGPMNVNKIGQIANDSDITQELRRGQELEEGEAQQTQIPKGLEVLYMHMLRNHGLDEATAQQLIAANELDEVHIFQHVNNIVDTHNQEVLRVAGWRNILAADSRKKRLQQKADSLAKNPHTNTILATLDDGSTLQKLDSENQGAYSYESDMQGNCVRHHGPDPEDPNRAGHGFYNKFIHSLRDSDDIPRLSFDMRYGLRCMTCGGNGQGRQRGTECEVCHGKGATTAEGIEGKERVMYKNYEDEWGTETKYIPSKQIISLNQVEGREDATPDDDETIDLLRAVKQHSEDLNSQGHNFTHIQLHNSESLIPISHVDDIAKKFDSSREMPQEAYVSVRGGLPTGDDLGYRRISDVTFTDPLKLGDAFGVKEDTHDVFKVPVSKKYFHIRRGETPLVEQLASGYRGVDELDDKPRIGMKYDKIIPAKSLSPVSQIRSIRPQTIFIKMPTSLRDNSLHYHEDGLRPYSESTDNYSYEIGPPPPPGAPTFDTWKATFPSQEEAAKYVYNVSKGLGDSERMKEIKTPGGEEFLNASVANKPIPWEYLKLHGKGESEKPLPFNESGKIEHKDPEYLYQSVNTSSDTKQLKDIINNREITTWSPQVTHGSGHGGLVFRVPFDSTRYKKQEKIGDSAVYKDTKMEEVDPFTQRMTHSGELMKAVMRGGNPNTWKPKMDSLQVPLPVDLHPLTDEDKKQLFPTEAYVHIPSSDRNQDRIYKANGIVGTTIQYGRDIHNYSMSLHPDTDRYASHSDVFKVNLEGLHDKEGLDILHGWDQETGNSHIRYHDDLPLDRLEHHRDADNRWVNSVTPELGQGPTLYHKLKQRILKRNILRRRQGNILNPVQPSLDPTVFDAPQSNNPKLKNTIRNWVKAKIYNVMENEGYEHPEKWLKLVLTGSLTTYQWDITSDFDVSLWIDIDRLTEADRATFVKLVVNSLDGQIVPGTSHPLQCFVVNTEQIHAMREIYSPAIRSAWDIDRDKWIVKPNRQRVHDIRHEYPAIYHKGLNVLGKMRSLIRYQPNAAHKYWNYIHKRRRDDMKLGLGDFTESNVSYKMIANAGLFPEIENITGEHIARSLPLDYIHETYSNPKYDTEEHVIRALLPGHDYIPRTFDSPEEFEIAKHSVHPHEVGYLSWWSDTNDKIAQTEEVQVHPDYWRMGIATKLITEAKKMHPHLTSSPYRTKDGEALLKGTHILPNPQSVAEQSLLNGPPAEIESRYAANLQNLLTPDLQNARTHLQTGHQQDLKPLTEVFKGCQTLDDIERGKGIELARLDAIHQSIPHRDDGKHILTAGIESTPPSRYATQDSATYGIFTCPRCGGGMNLGDTTCNDCGHTIAEFANVEREQSTEFNVDLAVGGENG